MEDNNWNQLNKMAAATVSGLNNELLASFFSSFVREPQIIHNLLLCCYGYHLVEISNLAQISSTSLQASITFE